MKKKISVLTLFSSRSVTENQGFFCDGMRRYGIPRKENDESIVCM